MDKKLIAPRINRLFQQREGTDTKVNEEAGAALGVSGEAVRQWRNGESLPRLDKLGPLVEYLTHCKIAASAQYILFGQPPTKPTSVEMLERIVEDGPELDLIRLFRASNAHGQARIGEMAEAIQLANPRPQNVSSIKQAKKRR